MGLDILLLTDNADEIFGAHYDSQDKSLSRTFCNLMCRGNVVSDPELDQIARITGVDISPIYQMENFTTEYDDGLAFLLSMASSEEEKQYILQQAKEGNAKLAGNLPTILSLVNDLIEKTSLVNDLPSKLNDHGQDTLGNAEYFADFNADKGTGYTGNNFGHDLRNFRRFLEYAQKNGASMVYFTYG